ncbi:hypothetical protein PENSPDRAFT_694077 [Peniophora sp. CONT]|nr:hypothetical protein PENSPDRAFT_694077 [Peniophora sp. CONT]
MSRLSASAVVMGSERNLVSLIIHYLDAETLIRVRPVSTLFDGVVQDEWRNRVYQYTSPFLDRVSHFYDILGTVEGVVSGSTALAVILSGSPRDGFIEQSSDLDVYVPTESAHDVILHYLVRIEGYEIDHTTSSSSADDSGDSFRRIASLTKLTRNVNGQLRSVDLIVGAGQCATESILWFWGTLVMNYISATSVVSIYPRTTLQGLFITHPTATDARLGQPISKYKRRHFLQQHYVHREEDFQIHGGSFVYAR